VQAFHGLGIHNAESLILVDALFLLDGVRRREAKKKEKKITMWEEGFPWAGPALLAVQWFASVRWN
jgi:hypothetical protein